MQKSSRIGFGPYMPDRALLANARGTQVALNAVPIAGGYDGIPEFAQLGFSALSERPRGAIAVIDRSGNPASFVGTETELRRFGTTNEDVTRTSGAYNCSGDARWEFEVFGRDIIAVNPNDASQVFKGGLSTNFEDLGRDGRLAPRAKSVATIGSILMMGNTFDAENGLVENAIHWSAVLDPYDWPLPGSDEAIAVQSDRQVLEGAGGAVQRVVGGAEVGAIFQERAIWRADFVGGDVNFQLNRVEPHRGLLISAVAVPFSRFVFYLAEDGFYLFDYTESKPIGRERVDRTFLADVDMDHAHRVSAVRWPNEQRIVIAYPGAGHSGGTPNRWLIYDWGLDQWSHGDQALELLVGDALAPGVDLDSPDTPSDPDEVDTPGLPSFDERQVPTGAGELGGFDATFTLGQFTGATMAATIETGRQELVPGQRSLCSGARPLVEATAPTVQCGAVARTGVAVAYGAASAVDEDGDAPLRTDGRYHRFRLNLPSGWSNALGMDVDFQASGRR